MKSVDGYNKLRGGYYTPPVIAKFIVEWAVRKPMDTVLEPSCGDGNFLQIVTKRMTEFGLCKEQIYNQVIGVELDKEEAQKAKKTGANIISGDFFSFYQEGIENKKKYDVVVGNPPFIRYQNFDEKYRKIAFELMEKHGFHPNRLTNIWLPFLCLSCKALAPNGRLGMVIPAELFQVDYAAETRMFLSMYFDRLTLITFKKLVFEEIQQEVVLLLGERKSDQKGIRVLELDGLEDLVNQGLGSMAAAEIKHLDHSREKWVKYYLTNEELELLNRLSLDPRICNAEDLYEVNVGLVSGENAFFLMNEKTVHERKIENAVCPIVGRSDQVKGVIFSDSDYDELASMGKKVFFFEPGDEPVEQMEEEVREYIYWGEKQGYNKNYKCRIRKRWYYVKRTWQADAFLIRQANLYPKMILNQKGALVTDTLHKVRFLQGVNGELVVAAFLNTYTLALSETLGRSYGGGVLTFEPGEMRRLRIPMLNAYALDIKQIDQWQREGQYSRILAYSDEILLKQGLNLSEHDISTLHSIWEKMKNRRLGRHRKGKVK